MRRNLLLAAVGDESLHGRWLRDAGGAEFDTILVSYGDKGVGAGVAERCRFVVEKKGRKWHLLSHCADEYRAEIDAYDAILCPDDDVLLTAADIDAAFRAFHANGLALAQPALGEGSHVLDDIARYKPYARLRYTDWVDTMAPIFSRGAWRACRPSFAENDTGWGLPRLWPKLVGGEAVAILDEVRMVHTRPFFSGPFWDNARPFHDLRALAAKYGLTPGANVLSVALRPDAAVYIDRLFDEDLPAALEANAEVARAIGARFHVGVAGHGDWHVDVSGSGPAVKRGAAAADCSVLFAGRDAFFHFLDSPAVNIRLAYAARQVAIEGRQLVVRRLPRVLQFLFSYGAVSRAWV